MNIYHPIFKTYFDAAKRILEGEPIADLEKIRKRCDIAYEMLSREENQENTPEYLVVSFVTKAENDMLLGANPQDVYGGFTDLPPEDARRRGRAILERVVDRYTKKQEKNSGTPLLMLQGIQTLFKE